MNGTVRRYRGRCLCRHSLYWVQREKEKNLTRQQGEAREATWRRLNWVLKISCSCQTEESREEAKTVVQKGKKGSSIIEALMKWDTVKESA